MSIGAYDFGRKGFPLTRHGGALGTRRDIPGMKTFAMVADHTASAEAVVNQANAWAKMKSSPYRWDAINASIDFINEKDTSLFPAFVAVDEDLARRATAEFGSLVDEDAEAIARTLGSKYKPERTVSAYVLFSPKLATTEDGVIFGVDFERKVLRGQASAVVLATDKGTVFGVFRPAKQKAPKQPAPTVAEKPAATPPAEKNASDMSLDELNQYLKRDGGGQ